MMTPEPRKAAIEEVRQMLARATPAQTKRLLDDIARIPVKKVLQYDA